MPPSDDKSYIDELNKSLYSRTAPDVRTRRKLRFSNKESEVKTHWDSPPEQPLNVQLNKQYKPPMSFFTKLFIFSALFCVVAVGVGAYLFFNGSNLISADNIEINISGPVSIAGGEPVTFDINVVNKNNIDLQLVDMSVDFPVGTTNTGNTGQTLTNFRKMIGGIPSGGSSRESVSAVMFGEENTQKDISVVLTYGIKGSTSVFTKRQSYGVLINSSPINVTVNSFKEVGSGQEFDIKLDVKSNSQQVLKDILLKAEYPFGFGYISSSANPYSGNSTWKIGDLPPGATRSLVIHGKLTGEDNDMRSFHFRVGAQSSTDSKVIGTEYMVAQNDILIQKPFISAKISVDDNQSNADYVGESGKAERIAIDWVNNLPTPISNVQIVAKLSGSAYDKNNVVAERGLFNSGTGEIVWNQRTNPELESVGTGETGKVVLMFTPRSVSSSANSSYSIDVSIVGNRTQESGVPENLRSIATRNVRLQSSVSLSGKIVRTVGPIVNTGPIPPKPEKTTTYTVVLDVDNASDAINNEKVTVSLPPQVKWGNAISPTGENIAFDANKGIVTWAVGNASSVSGSRRHEASFQISITPNVSQVGTVPILVDEAVLTATDNFAGIQLTSVQGNLTTRFSTDPTYKEGDERVSN